MDRKTYQKWKDLLSEYWSGGLSLAEYCRRHKLNPKTDGHWKKILSKDVLKSHEKSPDLEIVPLNLNGGMASNDSGVSLKIGNVRIELQEEFDVQTLKKVFALLEVR